MATSNIQYCTHRDIKDTYPNINDAGDTKNLFMDGLQQEHLIFI